MIIFLDSTDVDSTLTVEGKVADAKAVGELLKKKLNIPDTAKVGQAVVVKAVDKDGKPIEFDVVDMDFEGLKEADEKIANSIETLSGKCASLEENKSNVLVHTESGETLALTDSAESRLLGLSLRGKSEQNGTPTPDNPQEIVSVGDSGSVEVVVYGGNLADQSRARVQNSDKSAYVDGAVHISYKLSQYGRLVNIPFYGKKGVRYYIKWREIKNPNSTQIKYYFQEIEQYDNRESFVLNGDVTRIGVYIENGDFNENTEIILDNLMISEVDIPYEPYNKQTLTISTPNGLPAVKVTDTSLSSTANYTDAGGNKWYCDEVDLERGVYVKRVGEIVLNGSEKWNRHSNPTSDVENSYYTFIDIGQLQCGDGRNGMFSHFMRGGLLNDNYRAFVGKDTIQLRYDEIKTVYGLKTWLSDNNVTVYYILAGQIETPLTADELEAYKALHTNYPTTTVMNDCGADMEVEYVADPANHISQNYVPKASYTELEARVSALERLAVNS